MHPTTFILTAELDADSFGWLDALRRRHFPAERNWLPAHLTLFHTLTAAQVDRLRTIALPQQPLALTFDRVRFLGSGVAVAAEAPELAQLRTRIVAALDGTLTRQDAQSWQPHVTIQNKVPPELARALYDTLGAGFVARRGEASGLLVWEYLGGPWRPHARLPFATAPA
ncbi:2'-5' RNA ligase family protein [Rhodopseudomonas sp. HC1]|uniref:2'-5' RNA ligase family protein n=1 Tax=Rhodopseudomonas infernalis TaxID=2897386 RepID=UPI001EE7F380|nr:2'-5' RNA ligase family protein [Rhodopseudomonas infernalis]MCG6204123.1 2'-5' RNA ligase family protein [Rhodopseudomonas infernalis]